MFQTEFEKNLEKVLAEDGFPLGAPVYRTQLLKKASTKHSVDADAVKEGGSGNLKRNLWMLQMINEMRDPFNYGHILGEDNGLGKIVRRRSLEHKGLLLTYDVKLENATNRLKPEEIEDLLQKKYASEGTEDFSIHLPHNKVYEELFSLSGYQTIFSTTGHDILKGHSGLSKRPRTADLYIPSIDELPYDGVRMAETVCEALDILVQGDYGLRGND